MTSRNLRTLSPAVAFAGAMAALAPTAHADVPRRVEDRAAAEPPAFSVSLFTNTAFQRGKGFALFAEDPGLAGAGIAGDARVWQRGRWRLLAHAEVMAEGADGRWARGATRFAATSAALGGALEVRPLDLLRPYVQLTGGVSSARVRLSGVGEGSLAASDTTPFATGALGARLATRPAPWWHRSRPLSVSGFIEGSYTVAPAYDFTLRQGGDRETDAIPLEPVALGSVTRSRAQIRLGIGLHF